MQTWCWGAHSGTIIFFVFLFITLLFRDACVHPMARALLLGHTRGAAAEVYPCSLDVPFTARRARSQTPFTEGFRSKEMSLRCVQGLIPRSDYSRDPTERHHRAMCTILNCSAWRSLHRAPLDIKHDRTSSLIQALSMSPSHATPRTVASV